MCIYHLKPSHCSFHPIHHLFCRAKFGWQCILFPEDRHGELALLSFFNLFPSSLIQIRICLPYFSTTQPTLQMPTLDPPRFSQDFGFCLRWLLYYLGLHWLDSLPRDSKPGICSSPSYTPELHPSFIKPSQRPGFQVLSPEILTGSYLSGPSSSPHPSTTPHPQPPPGTELSILLKCLFLAWGPVL